MKKMLSGIFALLLAVATVFATTVEKQTMVNDTVYHWFDGQVFVGEGTIQQMSQFCNGLDIIECLAGYNPNVGETRPSTSPEALLTKD